jgi:hypothetical protein
MRNSLCARAWPRPRAAAQNLSAGIILAAVAGELLPLLAEGARGPGGNAGLTVGFAAGMLLVFGVGQHAHEDTAQQAWRAR